MHALALVAVIPLLLSLVLGSPGLLRTAEPIPLTSITAEVTAPPNDPAAADDEVSVPLPPHSDSPIPLPRLWASLGEGIPSTEVLKPIPAPPPPAGQPVVSTPFTPILSLLHPPRLVSRQGGPSPITAEQIVTTAEALLGVPYVWGGVSDRGLDCSAFVSRVWGVGRRTTESLPGVAFRIEKDELLPGDALNLQIGQDPRGYGHVRLFAGWANEQHSRLWVYEETPPRVIHRVISYDPRYTPLRRINYSPGNLAASHLLSMLFGKSQASVAAPAAVDDGTSDDADDDADTPAEEIATVTAQSVVIKEPQPLAEEPAAEHHRRRTQWSLGGWFGWQAPWSPPSLQLFFSSPAYHTASSPSPLPFFSSPPYHPAPSPSPSPSHAAPSLSPSPLPASAPTRTALDTDADDDTRDSRYAAPARPSLSPTPIPTVQRDVEPVLRIRRWTPWVEPAWQSSGAERMPVNTATVRYRVPQQAAEPADVTGPQPASERIGPTPLAAAQPVLRPHEQAPEQRRQDRAAEPRRQEPPPAAERRPAPEVHRQSQQAAHRHSR